MKKKIIIFIIFLTVLVSFSVALHSLFAQNAVGGDYWIFWNAGRAIFLEGKNPYQPEITYRIQMGIYQHPALPQQDQVAFAYPPYSLIVLLPTFWMTFTWGEAFWLALNLLLILTVVLILFPRGPKWLGFSSLLLYPVFLALIVGNFVVLIAVLILITYSVLFEEKKPSRWVFIGLGVALAWCTAKFQFSWLFLIFLGLESLRQKRWALVISFIAAMAIFLTLSWIWVPNWLGDWLARLAIYSDYVKYQTTTHGLMKLFLPTSAVLVISLIGITLIGLVTVVLFIRHWKTGRNSLDIFLWSGFVIYLVHPPAVPYEQISLFIPLLYWIGNQARKDSWIPKLVWLLFIPITWLAFWLGQNAKLEYQRIPLGFFAFFLIGYFLFERQILQKPEKERLPS